MNCEHRLTPDPRSGIQFCAKCGMDESKVKRQQKQSLTPDQVDDAILDVILEANLNPRLCIVHSAGLIALGRAVWARATATRTQPLTDEELADCGLLSELQTAGNGARAAKPELPNVHRAAGDRTARK